MKKSIYTITIILTLFCTSTYASTTKTENCACAGLAGNLPAITLIHSSKWGDSGLKSFFFENDDTLQAIEECEKLKRKLAKENICNLADKKTN